MPRFDVHIQLDAEAMRHGGGFYGFGGKTAQAVNGFQKLVNMFAKHLLTPVGTDPLDPTAGTQFPHLLGSNVGASDAKEILELSVLAAAEAIRRDQASADIPDDERLISATVTQSIVIQDGPGFAAQIYIENARRQGMTVLLPSLRIGRL